MLVTGCSDSTTGTTDPAGQGDAGNGQEQQNRLPHSGAPAVEDPVEDTREYEADPCTILPDDKLDDVGFPIEDSSEDLEASVGPRCTYHVEGVLAGTLGVSLAKAESGGLSHIYSLNEDGILELFEEVDDIHGHPAVIAAERDQRENGECDIYIGLRDDAGLDVQVTFSSAEHSEHHDAPCDAAYRLAELGIETLQAGE
nr:DUF3558 domain-containing protein [Haloechinothrix aidingensis]